MMNQDLSGKCKKLNNKENVKKNRFILSGQGFDLTHLEASKLACYCFMDTGRDMKLRQKIITFIAQQAA